MFVRVILYIVLSCNSASVGMYLNHVYGGKVFILNVGTHVSALRSVS